VVSEDACLPRPAGSVSLAQPCRLPETKRPAVRHT